METYISLLRAINVGGRMIKMEALRDTCEGLGFRNVRTYIQSGNIIFSYKNSSPSSLSAKLHKAIAETFGFDVPVLTLTVAELSEIIKNNPYKHQKDKDPAYLHITLLDKVPLPEKIKSLQTGSYGNDEFTCTGRAVYLYCPGGYGKTKLNNSLFEKKLGVTATTRNCKTSDEILRLALEVSR